MQQFVESRNLTHPIVLQGRDIARDNYLVHGYPTSYWIDRDGKIVDKEVGFAPGMEKQMRERIQKMLVVKEKETEER